MAQTVQAVKSLMALAEELVPKSVDVKEGEIGDLVESEMSSTNNALELAAKRFEVCQNWQLQKVYGLSFMF